MHLRGSVIVASAAAVAVGVAVRRRRTLMSYWTTPRGPVGWVAARVIPRAIGSVYPVAAQFLDLQPDDEVLEVACGSGVFLQEHAGQVRGIVGIDISDIQVGLARRRLADRIQDGTAQIVDGDAAALPWPDDRFSAVACLGSLECFPEPQQALCEMYRVLRPGGRAVFTIGARVDGAVEADKDTLGFWVWQEDDARRMMRNAGFADVTISYCPLGDTGTLFMAAYTLLARFRLVDAEARVVTGGKQPGSRPRVSG